MRCTGLGAIKKHVLVVDDHLDSAELLAILLEAQGFASEICTSLDQAKCALESRFFDYVFCDLILPDGTPDTLLPRARSAKVFAVSGLTRPEDRNDAIQRGYAGFLPKPIEGSTLQALLLRDDG